MLYCTYNTSFWGDSVKTFEQLTENVYLLKIPFGPVWTGVVLLRGSKNILIDSGATAQDVDEVLIPALEALGLELGDIHYLVNTHSHGDHIGGHARLRQIGNFQVVSFTDGKQKVENPVPYAIATRTKFPAFSPAPQCYLQGVQVDIAMEDGEILADRLQLIHTPGHDDDCVCWLDLPTKTLITGDSLQANGTICQGVGFYKSLPDYLYTLAKLEQLPIRNILCGHDYDGIGYWITDPAAALAYCRQRVEAYGAFIETCKQDQPASIAEKLIKIHGCGMPERLFMALYTVTEHLKENHDV